MSAVEALSSPVATETEKTLCRLPREFTAYLHEPLGQRPAGSPGKRGICELEFSVAHGTTRLRRAFVTHPFHLTRPWYLDAELPGMAVAYLQTPAGGLIQGDRASVQITLAAQAQVHLTTQAAEKIHTMTANCALQRSTFTLAAKAYAEYYPEPVILFPGSRFAQDTHIELGTGASCFFAEVFLTPRSAEGAAFEALAATLTVQDADGTLLLRDRSLVLPARQALAGPGVLAGSHIWGQAFLLGPSVPAAWAREVSALISAEHAVIGGATVLPWGRGLGVKIVGSDMRAIRRVLATAWNYLRVRHLGVPAPQFPK